MVHQRRVPLLLSSIKSQRQRSLAHWRTFARFAPVSRSPADHNTGARNAATPTSISPPAFIPSRGPIRHRNSSPPSAMPLRAGANPNARSSRARSWLRGFAPAATAAKTAKIASRNSSALRNAASPPSAPDANSLSKARPRAATNRPSARHQSISAAKSESVSVGSVLPRQYRVLAKPRHRSSRGAGTKSPEREEATGLTIMQRY